MRLKVGLARQNLVADGTGSFAAVETHVVPQRVADGERPAALRTHVQLGLHGALLRQSLRQRQ